MGILGGAFPPASIGLATCKATIRCSDAPDYVPVVKMCGITTPEDACLAAQAGARYIGMLLWPKSRRSVSSGLAREIAAAAREQGAVPVGVFVDENAKAIEDACREIGIDCAQLHGRGARTALDGLASSIGVVYVANVDKNGSIVEEEPQSSPTKCVEWTLIDNIRAGSGETFDWTGLNLPASIGRQGWFLAGGLSPENVASAISMLRPTGVDVSSGIAGPDGVRKDPDRIKAFMYAVRNWRCKGFQNEITLVAWALMSQK